MKPEDTLEDQHERLLEIISQEEDKLTIHFWGNPEERLRSLLFHYKDVAAKSLSESKKFRDQTMAYVKAMSLIADVTGNASTHNEKNARIRALVELCESAFDKLSKVDFDETYGRGYSNVYRCDYPTRHFLDRIRELEDKVRCYEKGSTSEDTYPFGD